MWKVKIKEKEFSKSNTKILFKVIGAAYKILFPPNIELKKIVKPTWWYDDAALSFIKYLKFRPWI